MESVLHILRSVAIKCIVTIILVVLSSGCATMDIPAYKLRAFESYQHKAETRGLFVAVNPLTEEEIEETFKTDLLEKGILPILVIAENRSASTSFILTRDKVAVVDRESTEAQKPNLRTVTSDTTGAILMVTGAAVFLPLVIAGMKMSSDAQVIQHNLGVKQFQSRTVDPGQKALGYVYLQYPQGGADKLNEFHVLIEATDTSDYQPIRFDFPISYTNR